MCLFSLLSICFGRLQNPEKFGNQSVPAEAEKANASMLLLSFTTLIRQIPQRLQGNHGGGESHQMLPKKKMGKGSGSSLFLSKVISLQKCKKYFSVFSVYGETNRQFVYELRLMGQ
jgi:hypothetical protein